MALTALLCITTLGQQVPKDYPRYVTEDLVGRVAWSVMEAPDDVTVRLAYSSRSPDPGGEPFWLRFVGEEVPVDKSRWESAWRLAKDMPGIVGFSMLNGRCGFHPDRLVTLRRGSDVVHMVTCHRCSEAKLYAPDRPSPVDLPLIGYDRTAIDHNLPFEWHSEAILEDGVGREALAVLRSGSPVFVASVEVHPLEISLETIAAVPDAAWRPSSPLLIEAILAGAAAFVRSYRASCRDSNSSPVPRRSWSRFAPQTGNA
jgi:hypothetical protein